MNYAKAPLILLVIGLLNLVGCQKSDDAEQDSDPRAENKKALGTSSSDLLSATPYDQMTIELVFTASFRPLQESIDGFKNFVLARVNKPGGVNFVERVIPNQPGGPFSLDEIRSIEETYRSIYTTDDHIAVYIFFSNGNSSNDTETSVTLGTAYRNTSIVIYQKTLEFITQSDPEVLPILEQTTLNHELGHILGLVNIQNDDIHQVHEDPNSNKHCVDEECLMYYDATNVRTSLLNKFKQLRSVPVLDERCRADLQAKGGL
ncbi:MAG: membrane metalloprotease [Bacteroidetes bacterium]|jgi:hypothetical protein|nr:membrane metalloprotease [Bacteroidota bacterium]